VNAADRLKTWVNENPLRHKKWEFAFRQARTFATYAEPGSLILLVGPTGSGKTRMLGEMGGDLAGPPEGWPLGQIPVGRVSLVNDVQGFFHSKDFYLRCLAALQHPYYSLHPNEATTGQPEALWLEKVKVKVSESHLRIALEQAIRNRGTRYFLLDEIDALLRVPTRQRSIDHLDSLRGLAKATGVVLVLAGTYLALQIWNRSAQLNRLTYDVHLGRYCACSNEDMLEFEGILSALSEAVPLPEGTSLRHWNELIYSATLGVMGEIVRLLLAALALMDLAGKSVLSGEILREAVMQQEKLDTLIRELRSGELILSGKSDLPYSVQESEDARGTHAPQHQAETKSKSRRRPGRRNPSRDPVGARPGL